MKILALLTILATLYLSGCFSVTVDPDGNVSAGFSYSGKLPVKGFSK